MLSIEEIKSKIIPIAKTYQLQRVYLFGSYARGEASEDSDIDFLIKGGTFNTLFAFSGLYAELEEAFQKPVDVVTAEALARQPDQRKSRYFKNRIKNEVKLLYDDTEGL